MSRLLICVLSLLLLACRDRQPEPGGPPDLKVMIDSVLPRLEVIAGLKKLRDVRMEEQSRDSLRKYIEARMQEELPAAELDAIQATYQALGVLSPDIDLKKLLLDLYTEQVVGYYDPVTKNLFVVKGVPTDQVRPVVVHELVHALQDQHTNLDSLIGRARGNDRQSAAQAAVEGHATVVMFAMLAEEQSGGPVDPRQLPDIGEQIRPSLEAQNAQFPVFQKAPRILRETMLFPYAGGASFVQKLWAQPLNSGFGDPYPAPLGEKLPQSTEQILHPESRFLTARDEPTELRLEGGSAKRVYENSLGELELSVVLEEHLGAARRRSTTGWDGDRYRLVEHDGRHALIFYSVWDDAASADAFAGAYREIAAKRTDRSITVERLEIEGRPGVRVLDAPRGLTLTSDQLPTARIAQ